MNLTELEADTLTELLNMGMGRAAASLGQMVGEEIELSVPHLEVLSRQEAALLIAGQSSSEVSAVRQNFEGPFHGTAMLLFPQAKSLELVRSLLGRNDLPLEYLTEMEQEALMEVGNIILNACLGTLANMMKVELQCGLPELLNGHCDSLMAEVVDRTLEEMNAQPVGAVPTTVILIIVDFTTRESQVKGYVVLMVDLESITNLRRELNTIFSRYQEDG